MATASIPAVGTGWHTTKMDFASNHIRVYWDGNLVIDHTDSATPFLTGGIGIDTAQASGAYVIAADDVEVIGPSQFEGGGTLTSSAFDGGVGAKYYNISWDASVPASTSLCVQTRTADRQELLSTEPWSDCYPASGADVTSPDRRWIQYQVTLGTTNLNVSPVFYQNGITYTPGSIFHRVSDLQLPPQRRQPDHSEPVCHFARRGQ